jgi:pimeloyl-ACP methyl ester carboxylesterase
MTSGTTPPRLRRAYFECRHGQLHVHNAIPVGGGFDELTTLICLHGANGSGRDFLDLSKRLGTTRSVYCPDLPGCGESDGAAARLSITGYADAIGDFLDSMRFRQVDLLGAGSGAAVAAELALARPKVVRKVCLLGMPAAESTGAAWRPERVKLVTQPILSLASDAGLAAAAPELATQLAQFLDP